MEAVFIRLLNMSIAASWLILAVIALRFLLKNAPKNIRRILWALVGIRLVLPFSPESLLSLIPSAETVSPNILYAEAPKIHSGISAFNAYVNPVISESLAPAAGASVNPMQVVAYIASIVWIIGMIVLMLYSVISYVLLRRRVADAVILRDNFWQSEKVAFPFVLGLFRPRIYLPFGMDDESLAYVVAHEKAHIKHRDHWIKPIGFLLLIVYWFNPLIWLAYILLCRDIELACDERVVKQMSAKDKKAYSKALLTCSIDRRSIAACPLAFGEAGVKQRIKNVLNYKKPAFWIIIAALASCVIVAVCFLTNPPGVSFDFDNNKISKVTTLDFRISPEPLIKELSQAQIDELESRLRTLSGLKHSNAYAGLIAFYSMTVWLDDGTIIRICGYVDGQNRVDISYKDKRYVITDQDFCTYLDNICAGGDTAEAAENKKLSLNDVIVLSQKGEDLSWQDFDQYQYIETGSGLYIRVYAIDQQFSLWIGGGSTSIEPMYIYLKSIENPDDYIDIRAEDVEAFISKYTSGSLDAAISAAILEHNEGAYPGGDFACESHVTMDTLEVERWDEESDAAVQTVEVYIMALYQEYGYAGGGFINTGGSHVPCVLTFDLVDGGAYELTEYWEPRDGSYYAPDIEERFKQLSPEVVADALDTQKFILAQIQCCYAQAVEHGNVAADYIVKELFESIMSSPAESSNPGDYIEAHPIEYRELTYYGDYTLRYIFSEFLKGGQTGLKGQLMRIVMDDLAPESKLRQYAETGQEYFDAWRSEAEKLKTENGLAYIQENKHAMWLLLQMLEA